MCIFIWRKPAIGTALSSVTEELTMAALVGYNFSLGFSRVPTLVLNKSVTPFQYVKLENSTLLTGHQQQKQQQQHFRKKTWTPQD